VLRHGALDRFLQFDRSGARGRRGRHRRFFGRCRGGCPGLGSCAARFRHWVEHRLPHRRDDGLWLVLVMGRAGAMADWDPLLIGQLLGDHWVLVFDNRGMAMTSNPSPEPVTVPLMVQDRLALADALLSRG